MLPARRWSRVYTIYGARARDKRGVLSRVAAACSSGMDDVKAKKAGGNRAPRAAVACRALVSPDDCRREVREQLLDRWGQSRPLYWRSPCDAGDASLYITRESLFRRGRLCVAPSKSSRIGSTPCGTRRWWYPCLGAPHGCHISSRHTACGHYLRETCRRGPPADTGVARVRLRTRLCFMLKVFLPSAAMTMVRRPCALQFSPLRNDTRSDHLAQPADSDTDTRRLLLFGCRSARCDLSWDRFRGRSRLGTSKKKERKR